MQVGENKTETYHADEGKVVKRVPTFIIHKSPFFLVGQLVLVEIVYILFVFVVLSPTLLAPPSPVPGTVATAQSSPVVILLFLATLTKVFATIALGALWLGSYYKLYPNEVAYRSGIFSRNEKTFDYPNAKEFEISQDVLGRIFNYGNLKLINPQNEKEFVLHNIPRPKDYLELVEDQVHKDDAGQASPDKAGESGEEHG